MLNSHNLSANIVTSSEYLWLFYLMKSRLSLIITISFFIGCDKNQSIKVSLPVGATHYENLSLRKDKLWYKKNSNERFSGDFFEMSGNEKWSEGSVKDGTMTKWVKYHLNGKRRSQQVWKNGKLQGVQIKWHSNGKKFIELNYKDGKELSANYWNKKGKAVKNISDAKK